MLWTSKAGKRGESGESGSPPARARPRDERRGRGRRGGGGVGTEIISDSASAPKQTADFLAQPPSQVVGADLAW